MRWIRIGVPRGQGKGQAATIAILNADLHAPAAPFPCADARANAPTRSRMIPWTQAGRKSPMRGTEASVSAMCNSCTRKSGASTRRMCGSRRVGSQDLLTARSRGWAPAGLNDGAA